ncbi:MAG: hypothetical protein II949_09305 [Prevotella sp.]|nr:hypothetical protein [Prevotella sp.]
MEKRIRHWYNRLLTVVLTVLGFGSSLMFMACYAPPPTELRYMEDEEVVDTVPLETSSDDGTVTTVEASGNEDITIKEN